MNKYFFKIRLLEDSTAMVQQVYWADSLAEAESELIRVYGDVYYENFTP